MTPAANGDRRADGIRVGGADNDAAAIDVVAGNAEALGTVNDAPDNAGNGPGTAWPGPAGLHRSEATGDGTGATGDGATQPNAVPPRGELAINVRDKDALVGTSERPERGTGAASMAAVGTGGV